MGNINKYAKCSLMTVIRLFFHNKSDDVLSRLLRHSTNSKGEKNASFYEQYWQNTSLLVLVGFWNTMNHIQEGTFNKAVDSIWRCYSLKSKFCSYTGMLTWSHQYLALWCMAVWPWLSSYLLQAVETCKYIIKLYSKLWLSTAIYMLKLFYKIISSTTILPGTGYKI